MQACIFDAHTHLHRHPSPEAALRSALASGLTSIVVCATSPEDYAAVLSLCQAHPQHLLPSFGLHPWWVGAQVDDSWQGALTAALTQATASGLSVGLGECGLDFSPKALAANPEPAQRSALAFQLRLAATLNLPVSLHCVRAHRALHSELAALPALPRGLLLHSWAGSLGDASRLLALTPHCLFSFSGGLVASAARALAGTPRVQGCASRDTLASLRGLPSSSICFETDAPDQAFQQHVSGQLRAAWGEEVQGAEAAEAAAAPTLELAGGTGSSNSCSSSAGCCDPEAEGGLAAAVPQPSNSPEHLRQVIKAAAVLLRGKYSREAEKELEGCSLERLRYLFCPSQ